MPIWQSPSSHGVYFVLEANEYDHFRDKKKQYFVFRCSEFEWIVHIQIRPTHKESKTTQKGGGWHIRSIPDAVISILFAAYMFYNLTMLGI